MDDRWPYPMSMTMQRHSGSAPKTRELARAVTSPPVAPATETDKAAPDGKAEAAQTAISPKP